MTGLTPVGSRVRFGEFELDLQTGELWKSDIRVNLPPQPAKVLALLVSRPAQLVTRDEIQREIWGDHTVVDFEHGLNFAIKKIRDTLGDNPEAPFYIETLPRRGHRFIARVEPVPAGVVRPIAPPEVAPPISKNHAASRPNRRLVTAMIGLVCALATAIVALSVPGLRDRLRLHAPFPWLAAAPRVESIAVLPFENLSSDADQEYFADGMTEELITSLGEVSDLRVISRTSVMRFKRSKEPLPEIARELRVDAVIEGTVARSGNHVRITANLVQAATDRHLWAQSYDSEIEDMLALQGNVARSIAAAVRANQSPEPNRPANERRVNPEAYEACLKGKYYLSEWTKEGFEKAIASFRRALDVDPTYAPAYEGLAEAYNQQALWGLQPAGEIYPTARAAAAKALELDDTLAEAHAVLGEIKLVFDWDWPGAEQELKRAIDLNPNSATAHYYYGVFLTAMSRSDEAIKEAQKTLELDPLTPTSNLQLGWVLYYSRHYNESIIQLKKTQALAPDFALANMELGWNYAQLGMYPEAVAECQRAISRMPDEQVTITSCSRVYALAGRRQEALALLAHLKEASSRNYVDPYNLAYIYDGLGDDSHAIEWLQQAYRERSASLYALKIETWSERLRTDPRFRDLVRRMDYH
jgi:TolB-like protein/DNA-binding winged helix-turn-helix (wHTH) protein/Tfp pilus assembly protein PilF